MDSRIDIRTNATISIILSPVNIYNTSVLLCLDTLAPVLICLVDSSGLVPKCLGSLILQIYYKLHQKYQFV